MNASQPHGPIDSLLGSFFKRQMPDPWPASPAERAASSDRVPAGAVSGLGQARLVLAASVLFLVFGYLAVARNFPAEPAQSGLEFGPEIGNRPNPAQKLKPATPNRPKAPVDPAR